MGNILISIKRFFQNKNTVTIFAILLAVGVIYFAYNYRIKKSTEPVSVPYATKQLGPRTYITSDMVSTRKVPGGIVTKDVITNRANVVGKYVTNTAVVPEGSLFYKSVIINWEDFPTSVFADIEKDETVYALPVSMETTYGNSIFPGNYIDIYYKTSKDNKVWIGKFIESIRVLDVQDASGNSVFETSGTPLKPSKLIFNLKTNAFVLFNKVKSVKGARVELFPVPRNANYSKNPGVTEIKGVEFRKFVEDKAVEDKIISGGKK